MKKKVYSIWHLYVYASFLTDAIALNLHFKILLEHGFLKTEERSY
jgi:hypothetical protein